MLDLPFLFLSHAVDLRYTSDELVQNGGRGGLPKLLSEIIAQTLYLYSFYFPSIFEKLNPIRYHQSIAGPRLIIIKYDKAIEVEI